MGIGDIINTVKWCRAFVAYLLLLTYLLTYYSKIDFTLYNDTERMKSVY